MLQRTITGFVAAAVFVSLLVLGGYVFEAAVGLLAFLALTEIFKMKKLLILSFEGILSVFAMLALVLPSLRRMLNLGADGPFLIFGLFIFFLLAGTVLTKGDYSFEDIAFPFLASFYVGFGFQGLLLAREKSLFIAIFAILIVWATDIGAYLVGSQFGRHKLLPEISPNKTIEGSLGGIAAAVLVSLVTLLIFHKEIPQLGYLQAAGLTVVFSVVAQLGDLVESALKRHYHVKDSGKLLPGHGGILDRFDSMIFVLPVMHIFGLF